MNNYLPKYFSKNAIFAYLIALVLVNFIFVKFAMSMQFVIFGIVEVVLFFYLGTYISKLTIQYTDRNFIKYIFLLAFSLRIVYVVFSYFYFIYYTGIPFEYHSADAYIYHISAADACRHVSSGMGIIDAVKFSYGGRIGLSDMGYPVYLTLLYLVTGKSIMIARLVKAILGAYTCVLIYRLARRNFEESIAKMGTLFCVLMPNMIYYCGVHLKEIEMLFLLVLFIERTDFVLKQKHIPLHKLAFTFLLGLTLFTFRTVLGMVAFLALFVAIIFNEERHIDFWKKSLLTVISTIFALIMFTGNIAEESNVIVENASTNQVNNMEWRANREDGNSFARYASGTLFLPVIFTIPFPTMLDIPTHEQQQMLHGGNYIKNIMSIFVIFALLMMIIRKEWRKYILLIAIKCGYLIVIAFSSFAHSERFHLPVLPFSMLLAAYGVSLTQSKHKKYYVLWLCAMIFADILWSWIQIKGRGW